MLYRGTDQVEIIEVSPIDEIGTMHYINIAKSATEPTFCVTCCCDEDWMYEFYLENNSDYERIKWNIMDAIFDCETMDRLLEELSRIFEDGFADIIVNHYVTDSDNRCNNCNCCE